MSAPLCNNYSHAQSWEMVLFIFVLRHTSQSRKRPIFPATTTTCFRAWNFSLQPSSIESTPIQACYGKGVEDVKKHAFLDKVRGLVTQETSLGKRSFSAHEWRNGAKNKQTRRIIIFTGCIGVAAPGARARWPSNNVVFEQSVSLNEPIWTSGK